MWRDTHPDAATAQFEALRRIGPTRRAALAVEMSESARATTLAAIRARHPEYDETSARLALFRLVLGDVLFARAWPTAPNLAP